MSWFDERNEDAITVSPDVAATGPKVGFFESWQVSVDAQMRGSSQFGIEYFMQELDWQQTQAMQEAGIEDAPQLGRAMSDNDEYVEHFNPWYAASRDYFDVAEAAAGQPMATRSEAQRQAYDKRIEALKQEYPDLELRTSAEMFGEVQRRAQEAERRLVDDRRTVGGAIAEFAGGALASMHPGTDPLNFYSLGVGGVGKTAITRIAGQIGAQGVVEGVNQVTGVQRERELLGLSHGFLDAASRVAMTAAGAGALQGLGEVAVAGARRWFAPSRTDPPPAVEDVAPASEPLRLPPPAERKVEAQAIQAVTDDTAATRVIAQQAPLADNRIGMPRVVADMSDMNAQLSDWAGGVPAMIAPRGPTVRLPGQVDMPKVDVQRALDNNALYQRAREIDPVAMARYDELRARKNTYRKWLDDLAEQRNADVQVTAERMEARIRALEAEGRTAQGKGNKARIREQIREVKADREELMRVSGARETPDIARVRREVVKLDEKMRELVPVVSRAYARARENWGETSAEIDAVWNAYDTGRQVPDVPEPSGLADYDTAVLSLTDRAPVLRQANQVEPRATSAETAQAVVQANAKVMDAALDAYRREVSALVEVSEEGKLRIEGQEYEFDLDGDTLFVPIEDGVGGREVTLREYLDDVRTGEQELEAVSACSAK